MMRSISRSGSIAVIVFSVLIRLSYSSRFCDDFWSLRTPKSVNMILFTDLNPFLRPDEQMFVDKMVGEVMVINKDVVVVLEKGKYFGNSAKMHQLISGMEGVECNTFLLLPNVLMVCHDKAVHFFVDKEGVLKARSYMDSYRPLNIISHMQPNNSKWAIRVFQEIESDNKMIVVNYISHLKLSEKSNTLKIAYKRSDKAFNDSKMVIQRLFYRSDKSMVQNYDDVELDTT